MSKDQISKEQVEEFSVELTQTEKKKIEEDAKREVEAQIKKAKTEAFKEEALRKAKVDSLFRHAQNEKGEDIVEVDLSYIPSFPKHIAIDGVIYVERPAPYRVTKAKAAVLRELIARGEEQEERRLNTDESDARRQMRQRKFRLSQKGLQQVA